MARRKCSTIRSSYLEGGLGLNLEFVSGNTDADSWMSEIPSNLLHATSVFPEHQYQMLWLAANLREAEQLLCSRPLLLALICEIHSLDNDAALALARLGQREILHALGLDCSKSALKFIDKLDLTYERESEMAHVVKQLDASFRRYRVFNHYPKVNLQALTLDQSYPFLTGTRLGKALFEQTHRQFRNLAAYLSDTLALGHAVGVLDLIRNIERLSSLEELVELHDRWVDEQLALRSGDSPPIDADIPYSKMLAETHGIVQIVDYQDLCHEAEAQKHCIRVYHNRIAKGLYCAFRLTSPERMTIGVTINRKKEFPFDIEQVRGYRNALPSEETRQIIHEWFEGCRKAALC